MFILYIPRIIVFDLPLCHYYDYRFLPTFIRTHTHILVFRGWGVGFSNITQISYITIIASHIQVYLFYNTRTNTHVQCTYTEIDGKIDKVLSYYNGTY